MEALVEYRRDGGAAAEAYLRSLAAETKASYGVEEPWAGAVGESSSLRPRNASSAGCRQAKRRDSVGQSWR